MDTPARHEAVDYSRVMVGIAAIVAAICLVVLTCWLVLSKQDAKLYEADSMVCVSQPFAVTCFERRAR